MSALYSSGVQTAVFDRLDADAPLSALVGTHIYDAVPAGPVPDLYVLIGEEAVKDRSDSSGQAAHHDITISVISSAKSFLSLKTAAAAITVALQAPELVLSAGRVAGLWPLSAQARRDASGQRKIDLKFRLRVEA